MFRLRIVLALALFGCLAASPALAGDFRHDDGSDRVVVITHLDVIPTFVPPAQPVIEQFVVDSRNDPGVELFIVISWTPTTNHFQLIRCSGTSAPSTPTSARRTRSSSGRSCRASSALPTMSDCTRPVSGSRRVDGDGDPHLLLRR
jgi:hypothetical protein